MNTIVTLEEIKGKEATKPLLDPFDLFEMASAEGRLLHEYRKRGWNTGPLTAVPELNDLFNGGLSNGLHVVSGAPSVGKSAFELQGACQAGCPVLYVTSEVPPVKIFHRVTALASALHSRTPEATVPLRTVADIGGGFLDPDKEGDPILALGRELLKDVRIMDASSTHVPLSLIEDQAGIFRNQANKSDERADNFLIVIDSLHAWIRSKKSERSAYDATSLAVEELKSLAMRASCAIVVIVERNRASTAAKKGEAPPALHSSKDSGAIEYSAETFIALDPRPGTRKSAGVKCLELSVEKSRIGGEGAMFTLDFDKDQQEFGNWQLSN